MSEFLPKADQQFDLVVVGGGVAGCSTALRFVQSSGESSVLLVERDDRLGGRLLSTLAGPECIRLDLGAMRYRLSQKRTRTLIEDVLGLSVESLPLGANERRFYLRGRTMCDADFTSSDGAGLPYRLEAEWRGLTPAGVVRRAMQIALGKPVDGLSPNDARELASVTRFSGRRLRDWDFWRLVHAIAGTEGYWCALDGAGIGNGTVGKWSAEEAIPWFLDEFRQDVTYRVLTNGFDSVTDALARRFEDRGGKIALGVSLQSLEPKGGAAGVALTLCTTISKQSVVVRAKRVVLALPPSALRPIIACSPCLSPVALLVEAVHAQGLMRLALRYEHSLCATVQPNLKRLLTDLPIRQVTFGIEPQARQSGAGTYVLCSFNDVRYPHFWGTLAHKPPGSDIVACELDATAPLVREAHVQLKQALSLSVAAPPTHAWFADWAAPGFGGGWHTWQAGVDAGATIAQLYNPVPGLPVHIVGEAFSREQAWVEGALQSVDGLMETLKIYDCSW